MTDVAEFIRITPQDIACYMMNWCYKGSMVLGPHPTVWTPLFSISQVYGYLSTPLLCGFGFADYLFSNEYINHLISYKFDFRNEELLAYYIIFLRYWTKGDLHTALTLLSNFALKTSYIW